MIERILAFLSVALLLGGMGSLLGVPTIRSSSLGEDNAFLPLQLHNANRPDPFPTPAPEPHEAEDFELIAQQGLGDRGNSVAWSMQWWDEHLYVGTSRHWQCYQTAILSQYSLGNFPPQDPDILCPDQHPEDELTPQDLPLQGEIWRWSPLPAPSGTWEMVHRSASIGIPGHPGKTVGQAIGYRAMQTFTEQDGTMSLYVAPFTSRDVNDPTGEEMAPPQLLRTVDGTTWLPVPSDPGTFMGELDERVDDSESERVEGFRSMTEYDGHLFVVASGAFGHGPVIASAAPQEGNDSFFQATPPHVLMYSLEPFNGQLYFGTGDQPLLPIPQEPGYQIYRTTPSSEPPYDFENLNDIVLVVPPGAHRTQNKSKTVVHMEVFDNRLYAGTNQPAELVRVNPDDTWDLIMGEPRLDPDSGDLIEPLSGFGDGFDEIPDDDGFNEARFNIHVHRMQTHDGVLYVGTNDQSTTARNRPNPPLRDQMGFDLYATTNGTQFTPITVSGLSEVVSEDDEVRGEVVRGGLFNLSARSFASTPYGLFLGTQNYYYGLLVFLARGLDHVQPAASDLETEVVGNHAVVSWAAAPGAVRYHVYRSAFTVNREVQSLEYASRAWVQGPFTEIGVTDQTHFVDRDFVSATHFYHYYVVAENRAGVSSKPSNLMRAPSLLSPLTFQGLQRTIARWSIQPLSSDQYEDFEAVAATLEQASAEAAAGNLSAALGRINQLRASIGITFATRLPEWRRTDVDLLLMKLERRVHLAQLGLLPGSALSQEVDVDASPHPTRQGNEGCPRCPAPIGEQQELVREGALP